MLNLAGEYYFCQDAEKKNKLEVILLHPFLELLQAITIGGFSTTLT